MNDDFDFGLYDERVIIPSVKEEIITEKETVVVQEEIPEKEEEISLELWFYELTIANYSLVV
jgi:hypothetical protein